MSEPNELLRGYYGINFEALEPPHKIFLTIVLELKTDRLTGKAHLLNVSQLGLLLLSTLLLLQMMDDQHFTSAFKH